MFYFPLLDDPIRLIKKKRFDDTVNRLHNFYTPLLMLAFTVFVTTRQAIGRPIRCWVPMEFSGLWERYAENYCFVQNTFYVPLNASMPPEIDREELELNYYQWIPFVFALQALMFYLPKRVWPVLLGDSIDLDHVLEKATELRTAPATEHPEKLGALCLYLAESLRFKTQRRCRRRRLPSVKRISAEFLLIKLVYLLNLALQFWLLSKLIGVNFLFWGRDVFIKMIATFRVPHSSAIFPIVTNCDFLVRRLANVNRYSVQCVLMANALNEKLFLVLWFWLVTLAVVSALNLLYNCIAQLIPPVRERLTMTNLERTKAVEPPHVLFTFCRNELKADGALILSLIQSHAGKGVANDVADSLFSLWKRPPSGTRDVRRNMIYPPDIRIFISRGNHEPFGMQC